MGELRVRPGGSAVQADDAEPGAMVILIEYDPADVAAADGRRPSDNGVGMAVGMERARNWCAAINCDRERKSR